MVFFGETETETETERDRQTERGRQRETDRDRETERVTERERIFYAPHLADFIKSIISVFNFQCTKLW